VVYSASAEFQDPLEREQYCWGERNQLRCIDSTGPVLDTRMDSGRADDECDPLMHIQGFEQEVEISGGVRRSDTSWGQFQAACQSRPRRSGRGPCSGFVTSRYCKTLSQRYDEVGLPCNRHDGVALAHLQVHAISLPRTRSRCFWYGNAAEIMLGSLSFFLVGHFLFDFVGFLLFGANFESSGSLSGDVVHAS
jgi:hypothetical protein